MTKCNGHEQQHQQFEEKKLKITLEHGYFCFVYFCHFFFFFFSLICFVDLAVYIHDFLVYINSEQESLLPWSSTRVKKNYSKATDIPTNRSIRPTPQTYDLLNFFSLNCYSIPIYVRFNEIDFIEKRRKKNNNWILWTNNLSKCIQSIVFELNCFTSNRFAYMADINVCVCVYLNLWVCIWLCGHNYWIPTK